MKYVGSKSRLSKDIVPILQHLINTKGIKTYVEPFVGGANIIDKIECDNKLGYDLDPLPITIFNNYESKGLKDTLPEILTKEHYYDVRDSGSYDETYRACVLLFGSYNARVYGGCFGGSAQSKQGFRNYFQEAKRNLEKQLPSLANVVFEVKDFFDLNIKDSLIYCDPPYKGTISYVKDFDTEKFWNKVRELSKDNTVVVSEYDAPSDFISIYEKEVKDHMNNRNKLVKTEKLFILK